MNKGLVAEQRGPDSYKLNIYTGFFSVLLLIVFFYLMLQAVLSGLVYINQYRINATLDGWYADKQAASQLDWEKLEDFAISSLEGKENNTTILYAIGRVYDYRSSKLAKDIEERVFYGEKSIAYYRQVIDMRPAWPYGWMSFVLLKARLGRLDDEYEHGLVQLQKTGAWEKHTLPVILQLSLFSWYSLNSDSQKMLFDYFLVAQDKRTSDVQSLLWSVGQLKFYCRLIKQRGATASFCN